MSNKRKSKLYELSYYLWPLVGKETLAKLPNSEIKRMAQREARRIFCCPDSFPMTRKYASGLIPSEFLRYKMLTHKTIVEMNEYGALIWEGRKKYMEGPYTVCALIPCRKQQPPRRNEALARHSTAHPERKARIERIIEREIDESPNYLARPWLGWPGRSLRQLLKEAKGRQGL